MPIEFMRNRLDPSEQSLAPAGEGFLSHRTIFSAVAVGALCDSPGVAVNRAARRARWLNSKGRRSALR